MKIAYRNIQWRTYENHGFTLYEPPGCTEQSL